MENSKQVVVIVNIIDIAISPTDLKIRDGNNGLAAPTHYLYQCYLVIKKVQWHLSKGNFTRKTSPTNQNGRRFADDVFKCIFLNKNIWISHKISLKILTKVQINNTPALVQILAWRRSGVKPLSESMMFSLLTHICVTQWVNLKITYLTFHEISKGPMH